MHGREQREGENHRRIVFRSGCSQHMRSVPLSSTRTSIADADTSLVCTTTTISTSTDYFCKDGRKISVGDCALFKPPQDSPPFIGLIRWLALSKENHLQLGVNWLYRPAEVKLGKGILLEAAPNEVFYSFHKDETPAASLLHPCKVAFLPRGVELPTGISSFFCRRVYDIKNKCLWWLSDQDYIDERQEEVDKLLDKTRKEMDAVVQTGGRSPKPTHIVATSQLKPGSDNLQNSPSSIPSQTKGKKRERGDHMIEAVKRERFPKKDDSDSGMVRAENSLAAEISKITEKGGLVDSESVEKFIQLMQPIKIDKKLDLVTRSMLAGVIAATDRFDCLSRFVLLKGLPVLDEWLQDVQKRKTGDGSSSKDGDKSSEEFLLVLLRALDKLPVNLNALQTSNIGRSVNHLRSHKNLEIQKKARSLVDTWKKRVEAEMNVIDAKSASTHTASWPSKSRLSEGHGARNTGDIALKSSVTQLSTSKLVSIKGSQGETTIKSPSSSPGPVKSSTVPASGKEGHLRATVSSTSDVPLSTREDKSSSSSQSHNYSQSFSGKEDARSSTTGSMTVSKISGGSSRHRKSSNSFPGTSASGSPKETGSSRHSSIDGNATQEKFSQSALMGEKALDAPATDGSSHKLIVKIPNRGCSPAQSIGGGSFEDPSIMSSRASSPVLSDRHEQSDSNSKEKCDTSQATVTPDVNAESWQSNDTKDLQTGSDEGDGSPAGLPEEEHSRTVGNTGKTSEVSKVASSLSRNDTKSGLYESSFNSMYALIESCAKYAETSPSMSVRDDIGMNLLASVAAGEICKSELISTTDLPQASTAPVEEICTGDDAKSKPSPSDNYEQDRFLTNGTSGGDGQAAPAIGTWSKDGIPLGKQSSTESSKDRKPTSSLSEETLEATVHDSSVMTAKSDDTIHCNSVSHNGKAAEERDGDESKQSHKTGVCYTAKVESVPQAKLRRTGSLLIEVMASNGLSGTEDVKQNTEVPLSIPSKENGRNKEGSENLKTHADTEQKPTLMADGEATQPTIKDLVTENLGENKVVQADQNCGISCFDQSVGQELNKTSKSSPSDDHSSASDRRSDCTKTNSQNKVLLESSSTASSTRDESPACPSQDTDGDVDLKVHKLSDAEADKTEECTSTVADTISAAGSLSMNPKMKFDLNEGLNGDDGKIGEPISSSASGCLSSVHLVNTLSSSISTSSGSIPASIMVAAAAKGPFVPPIDLLRSKGELGWKGSAATSAFRPAEPRKVLQLPVAPINASPPDDSTSRPCRPPLDIDLNVPDERILEDLACRDSAAEVGSTSDHSGNYHKSRNDFTGSAPGRSSGGLDLDLNRVDDANDMMQFPPSSSHRLEASIVPVKTVSSSSLSACEVRRNFDLNNGPGVDDAWPEQSSFHLQGRGSTHILNSQAPVVGSKPSSLESGSFSAWFPPGNSYSSVTIPPVLPDRGEQTFPIIPPGVPQRILGPPSGNPFAPEIYRGSVLSSSPAVHFPASPFPYQMFPFGTTMPLPSATFSVGSTSYMDSTSVGRLFNPANAQFLAPVCAVSSQYPRPYMVSLPDGVTNGSVDNTRKWSRHGLDLNAGPGALDIEGREEILAQRQLLAASSQALAEDQARIYPAGGSVLKRKEPEGGWDNESFRYKQPSWQ